MVEQEKPTATTEAQPETKTEEPAKEHDVQYETEDTKAQVSIIINKSFMTLMRSKKAFQNFYSFLACSLTNFSF